MSSEPKSSEDGYGSVDDVQHGVASGSKQPFTAGRMRALASAFSNFSIQYNYQSASIAVAMMGTHNDTFVADATEADFPSLPWVDNTLLAVVFLGSMAGMLFMGFLGDLIGCRRALLFTKGLAAAGALTCALLPSGSPNTFWSELAFGRLVLGVGLGGAYPLSAASAAGAESRQAEQAGQAFVWQAPGSVAPYILALMLLWVLPHEDGVTSKQFRWLLGLGAVPALVALAATWSSLQREGCEEGRERRQTLSLRQVLLLHPELQTTLLGTAGTWFLFDVAAYGTVIFTPRILEHVFGMQQSLPDLAGQSIIMLSFAIPASCLAANALPRLGAKTLNTLGFVSNAICFAIFAVVVAVFPDAHLVLFIILCGLSFSLNWGPNVATYVLPVEAFPPEFRSTFHGVSAAAGKLGALVGAFLFPLLDSAYGVPTVMGLQAVVCVLGALLSQCCLSTRATAQASLELHQQQAVAARK